MKKILYWCKSNRMRNLKTVLLSAVLLVLVSHAFFAGKDASVPYSKEKTTRGNVSACNDCKEFPGEDRGTGWMHLNNEMGWMPLEGSYNNYCMTGIKTTISSLIDTW